MNFTGLGQALSTRAVSQDSLLSWVNRELAPMVAKLRGALRILTTSTDGSICIKADPGGCIALGAEPESFQGMEGGLFLGNCTAAPTGDPVDGGYLIIVDGALSWHGSAGTVTPIAPA